MSLRHACAAFLFLLNALRAEEVQRHGLVFEQWVRDTFFEKYVPPSPTQKWDIPAAANRSHGGIPVNPKATKFGTPVDMGDALRQFAIEEPFLLVIGYWKQEGEEKRFVNIVAPRIEPEAWRKLWGPVTLADLQKLDVVVKDRTLTPASARAAALRLKNQPPFTQAVIQVNPKIDEKGQRRLQCSLRFADVFKHVAPGADPAEQDGAALWEVPFPGPLPSQPRAPQVKPPAPSQDETPRRAVDSGG